jgi:hypothetical protein
MRFGAHQTFHLRDSWLHKGLKAIAANPKALHDQHAFERMGMGKNMIESLRYWLEATQVAVKDDEGLHITEEASLMMERDPYFELDGTLQFIHYLLATNEESATVWQWFFNKFSVSEFDAESVNVYLQSYIDSATDRKINPNTLGKDVNCLLKMYKNEEFDPKKDPETNNPSPFGRFRWLDLVDNKYVRREVDSSEIDPQVFVHALYFFWVDVLQEVESISLEDIAARENSPGMVFGLSIDQCAQMIETISRLYPNKYLNFNKTGGYFIINLIEKNAQHALEDYYNENQLGVE